MSGGAYERAHELVDSLQGAVRVLQDELGVGEGLARTEARERARGALGAVAAARAALEDLLDWVEASDLPPGLRSAVEQQGLVELRFDPSAEGADADGLVRGPSPAEAGEALPALLFCAYADRGEEVEDGLVDVVVLPAGTSGEPPRGDPSRADPVEARVRLRVTEPEWGDDAPPAELVSLYLEPRRAVRAAALLRRSGVRAMLGDRS